MPELTEIDQELLAAYQLTPLEFLQQAQALQENKAARLLQGLINKEQAAEVTHILGNPGDPRVETHIGRWWGLKYQELVLAEYTRNIRERLKEDERARDSSDGGTGGTFNGSGNGE